MKMDQIKYRLRFSDEDQNCWQGFPAYKDKNDNIIIQRDVVCYGQRCESGAMVTFEIEEIYSKVLEAKRIKSLFSRTYYDKENAEYRALISNLASNQLRDKIGEDTAHDLYYKLFLYSEWMRICLPNVVKYSEERAKQYNWPTNCGVEGYGSGMTLEELKEHCNNEIHNVDQKR